jgi:hypothetical protein
MVEPAELEERAGELLHGDLRTDHREDLHTGPSRFDIRSRRGDKISRQQKPDARPVALSHHPYLSGVKVGELRQHWSSDNMTSRPNFRRQETEFSAKSSRAP